MKHELESRLKRLDEFDGTDGGRGKDSRRGRGGGRGGGGGGGRGGSSPRARSRKDIERERRRFGPCTRFGEGDGTYWDRWLVAAPPSKSPTQGTGTVMPVRGFKSACVRACVACAGVGMHTWHSVSELCCASGVEPAGQVCVYLKLPTRRRNEVVRHRRMIDFLILFESTK